MKKFLVLIPLAIALFAFKPEEKKQSTVSLTKKWETDTIMKVPESVLYNPSDKFIYVSNINDKPDGKDGNGFISRITLDGKVEKLKWVTGLDAPKGMGIYKGKLYVTDITNIAVIDVATAKIERKINVTGSVFLNDVTVDANGNIYISDSSTKKIHLLKNGTVTVWLENPAFVMPNGLLAQEKGLRIIDMGTGIFYEATYTDKKLTQIATEIPGGDGVMYVSKDEYIISCWPGEIYYVKAAVAQKILDTKAQKFNAADAWYIESEKLLIIPTFFGNTIAAYTVAN